MPCSIHFNTLYSDTLSLLRNRQLNYLYSRTKSMYSLNVNLFILYNIRWRRIFSVFTACPHSPMPTFHHTWWTRTSLVDLFSIVFRSKLVIWTPQHPTYTIAVSSRVPKLARSQGAEALTFFFSQVGVRWLRLKSDDNTWPHICTVLKTSSYCD